MEINKFLLEPLTSHLLMEVAYIDARLTPVGARSLCLYQDVTFIYYHSAVLKLHVY